MAQALVKSLQKIVVTAGTQLPLSATSIQAYSVKIKALAANSGIIYIGDLNVSAANGFALAAGQELDLSASALPSNPGLALDLSQVYVDASASADAVCVVYVAL